MHTHSSSPQDLLNHFLEVPLEFIQLGHWPSDIWEAPLQWASPVAQMVKNLPAMQETWVRPPGREDPLENGMATHSSIVAWRIPKDRGAWLDAVLTVAKSRTRLSQLTPSLYSVFSWMICGTSHRLQVC